MNINRAVDVRLVLDDEFYEDDGCLTDQGWAVLEEMVESVNGTLISIENAMLH